MNPEVRHATLDELRQLSLLMGGVFTENLEVLSVSSVAVFPHYCSDSPGYQGRIAVVVYPGGPELFDCFCLDGEFQGRQRKEVAG